MPFGWADTLMLAERAHLLRLMAWGAMSVLVGTALLAWTMRREPRSPLLRHFAIQTAAWGAVDLLLVALGFGTLTARDVAAATRLDRFVWLNIGLDAGYVMIGITLAVVGWRLGRRLGLVGAGTAIVVQGTALALLDLILASHISR
ncbi:MAG: hypothetical protein JWL60_765 [Gemmatimonadetes bacterium]|jgi:hypothetical protein|nr:hypothetical protein [Gemmatimonadota bacterium]